MFQAHRQILSLSEHDTFVELLRLKHRIPRTEFDTLTSAVLRVCFPPRPAYSAYFVKYRFFAIDIIEDVHRVSPQIHHVYLCRHDPVKTLKSYRKAYGDSLLLDAVHFAQKYDLWRFVPKFSHFDLNEESRRHANLLPATQFCSCVVIWASNTLCYDDLKSKIVKFPKIYYEDLLRKPQEVLQRLLNLCDLTLETTVRSKLLPNSSEDSQETTAVSRRLLRNRKFVLILPELKLAVNEYCAALNLPNLW